MQRWLSRLSPAMPVLSLGASIGLAAWAWFIGSPKAPLALGCSAVFCTLVIGIELYWRTTPHRAVPEHRLFLRTFYFANAGVAMFALGADLLRESGAIAPAWRQSSHQVSGLLFGVALVFWGNFLPKLMSPWTHEKEPFNWHGVHRFNGWIFVLAGVVIVASHLILPWRDANRLQILVFLTAVLLGVGRKFVSIATTSRARQG